MTDAIDKVELQKTVESLCSYMESIRDKIIGEYNDKILRNRIKRIVSSHLNCKKRFKVCCDETNNPVSIIDSNKLVVGIKDEKYKIEYSFTIY